MSTTKKLIQKHYELNINATDVEIYNCLHYLTDEDFNGNNGSDYYMTFETPTGTKSMSRLEGAMMNLNEYNELGEFIEYVLADNYALDPYYADYQVFTTVVYDTLVIVLSFIL